MAVKDRKNKPFVMDRELLNTHNEKGCGACGKKFNLGDMAVVACGGWGCEPRIIHESEAVYDPRTESYIERNYASIR